MRDDRRGRESSVLRYKKIFDMIRWIATEIERSKISKEEWEVDLFRMK